MPMSRVQPEKYPELLRLKAQNVCSIMARFSAPPPQIFASQPTGFRLRAEFRIWHEAGDIQYVMFRPDNPKTPVTIAEFPIAAAPIQSVMPVLLSKLSANEILSRKLFQVEFLTTMSGEMLITLVYHRKLDNAWEESAARLARELRGSARSVSIIGRSRKQKLTLVRDFVEEVLLIQGNEYRYRQYEQSFSQPNGNINICMIEWACDQASALTGDLLELYCGNGNFTLPLARHFNNIIATEVSKTSIRAARENLEENSIKNVHLVRLSAEEVAQALSGQRLFRRLSELPVSMEDFDFNTIFVDPPRAGLDAHTLAMASHFQTILYISCNPHSLVDNLEQLHQTHQIERFALFDQFPYTDHMECGVLLTRRSSERIQA